MARAFERCAVIWLLSALALSLIGASCRGQRQQQTGQAGRDLQQTERQEQSTGTRTDAAQVGEQTNVTNQMDARIMAPVFAGGVGVAMLLLLLPAPRMPVYLKIGLTILALGAIAYSAVGLFYLGA